MTRSKRFLTTLLTTATVVTTFIVPASAGTQEAAAVHLTNYDTPYTTVVNLNGKDDVPVTLKVQGAGEDWKPAKLTRAQAETITWKELPGSAMNLTVPEKGTVMRNTETGYYVQNMISVPGDAAPGFAVVEANMGEEKMDFTVMVNQEAYTSVTNIKNIFYDATSETPDTALDTVVCPVVTGSAYEGQSRYASPLDCPAAVKAVPGSKVTDYYINADQNMLTALTINGKDYNTDPEDWATPGWLYRVYDSTGHVKALSADVGADVFNLSSNDIVVWKYGTYGTTFADTISVE